MDALPEAFKEAASFQTGRLDTWEELGSGGNKDVYAVSDTHAVGVLKPGKPTEALLEELDMLRQLEGLGLPTVKAEASLVDGYPALLFERFSQGSKDVVKLDRGKIRIVGDSKLLTERSVHDLQTIKQKMQEDKIKIDDLQFLVGADGRIVISDPLAIHVDTEPSKNNIRMIDLLIEQARKNQGAGGGK